MKTFDTENCHIVLYDRGEVAKMLGVSKRSVWQYIKDGRLPAVMIDHKWLVLERNLVAFVSGARSKYDKRNFEAVQPAVDFYEEDYPIDFLYDK